MVISVRILNQLIRSLSTVWRGSYIRSHGDILLLPLIKRLRPQQQIPPRLKPPRTGHQRGVRAEGVEGFQAGPGEAERIIWE